MNGRFFAGALAVLLLSILCTGTLAAATLTFFGGTASGGSNSFSLVEIDYRSGATVLQGEGSFWTGLDFSRDGLLYGVSDDLDLIDPEDGSFTRIGPLSLLGGESILMKSMTISPAGEMFVLSNQFRDPSGEARLYTVDTATGALALVGNPSTTVSGIEFAPDGTLYSAAGFLSELDPSDASTVRTIGVIEPNVDIFVTELDYSTPLGLVGIDRRDGFAQLYQLDPDGVPGSLARLLATIPDEEVTSIASIPEPALLQVALAALLMVFGRRTRAA